MSRRLFEKAVLLEKQKMVSKNNIKNRNEFSLLFMFLFNVTGVIEKV